MTKNMRLQLDAVVKTINAITCAEVNSDDRKRENVDARFIFYKIAKDIYKLSFTKIAKYLNKHHATILYGIKQFDLLFETDKRFRESFNSIVALLDEPDIDAIIVESKDLFLKYIQERNEHLATKEECKRLSLQIKKQTNDYILDAFKNFSTLSIERILREPTIPSSLSNILIDHLENREKKYSVT